MPNVSTSAADPRLKAVAACFTRFAAVQVGTSNPAFTLDECR